MSGGNQGWRRSREVDRFGREGVVYLSDCGRWKVSDEGPAPWTLLERDNGSWQARGEHPTLAGAKAATWRAVAP